MSIAKKKGLRHDFWGRLKPGARGKLQSPMDALGPVRKTYNLYIHDVSDLNCPS